ncbi:MAG: hypothetical protein ACC645_18355, partial [Pirellulales bacterium]
MLRFDADDQADLLAIWPERVGGGSSLGWIFSGADISDAYISEEPFDVDPANPSNAALVTIEDDPDTLPLNQSDLNFIRDAVIGIGVPPAPTSSTKLTVTVAGDVNGDGLEDLLFANPEFVDFGTPGLPMPKYGRVYVVLGRPTPPATITVADDNIVYQDFALGGSIAALGDLNRDGYDDFAIGRTEVDASYASGSLLVFYGSAAPASPPMGLLGAPLPGDITIRRDEETSLTPGISIHGALTATAGDLNGDGRMDLVVGQPSQSVENASGDVLNQDARGHVYVYWSIADRGSALLSSEADVVLDGQGQFDRLGTLPRTPQLDLDGDRFDDLVVGAATADVLAGSVLPSAGKVYFIYGSPPRPFDLSQVDVIDTITNRTFTGSGDFLVDRGTGQPAVFADADFDQDGNLDTDRYTLAGGQTERWYKFTTLGDGWPGHQLRAMPPAEEARALRIEPVDGLILDPFGNPQVDDQSDPLPLGGGASSQLVMEFDLSSLLPYLDELAPLTSFELQLDYRGLTRPLQATAQSIVAVGNRLFFATTSAGPAELAVSDGTSAGTRWIGSFPATPQELTSVGDEALYFAADDGAGGNVLWRSDGTPPGTEVVVDPQQNVFAAPSHLVDANGVIYFAANNGSGPKVWRLAADGVPEAIGTEPPHDDPASNWAVAGDRLFFITSSGGDFSLWSIEATSSTPTLVDTFTFAPTLLTAAGDMLYFAVAVDDLADQRVFRSDGIGAVEIADPTPPVPIFEMSPIGGQVAFVAGTSLWVSSGASASPVSTFATPPMNLTDVGGTLYFSQELNLMNYDGQSASSVKIFTSPPANLTEVDGQLYFTAGGTLPDSLWLLPEGRSSLNASEVLDPFNAPLSADRLAPVGDTLVFTSPGISSTDLFAATGATAQPINSVGPFLLSDVMKVEVLVEEGDGLVDVSDRSTSPAAAPFESLLMESDSGLTRIDVTSAMKGLLAVGKTRATVRISLANSNSMSVDIERALSGAQTGLEVTIARQEGVLLDVLDADGGRIAEGESTVDMRAFEAGKFFVRVFDPFASGAELPFTLEFVPPIPGTTHPASDRDELHGGDGDDTLIGGAQLDRLFGESGADAFIAEPIEVIDWD